MNLGGRPRTEPARTQLAEDETLAAGCGTTYLILTPLPHSAAVLTQPQPQDLEVLIDRALSQVADAIERVLVAIDNEPSRTLEAIG